MTGRGKRFRAVLEKDGRALAWTIARLPFGLEEWKAGQGRRHVRLRVRGEIWSSARAGVRFAFRTSLFPDPGPESGGGLYLLVNRAMQQGAGVRLGDAAEFLLEPDLDPREAELPGELEKMLLDSTSDTGEPGLREWYDGLTESTRREIGKWVLAAKSGPARMRRAQQMAERLLATMEGERELPPVIEAAFHSRPKARAGWARLTPTERRGELLAVFYYRTVDARRKRVEKLLEKAEARA